jgi:hypothetical protein
MVKSKMRSPTTKYTKLKLLQAGSSIQSVHHFTACTNTSSKVQFSDSVLMGTLDLKCFCGCQKDKGISLTRRRRLNPGFSIIAPKVCSPGSGYLSSDSLRILSVTPLPTSVLLYSGLGHDTICNTSRLLRSLLLQINKKRDQS